MNTLFSIDKKGNEKIIGQYELFSTNDNGYHHILDSNNKYGLINQKIEEKLQSQHPKTAAIYFSINYPC